MLTKIDFLNEISKFLSSWEGGLVNNPKDPGGLTNRGVTKRTFDSLSKKHNFEASRIEELTNNDFLFVVSHYVENAKAFKLRSQSLAFAVSNFYWHSGYHAFRVLAQTINNFYGVGAVQNDQTLKSFNFVDVVNLHLQYNEETFVNFYLDKMLEFQLSVVHDDFKKGIKNRIDSLRINLNRLFFSPNFVSLPSSKLSVPAASKVSCMFLFLLYLSPLIFGIFYVSR